MELLTILYALLAAVTGIGGGERAALVDRAAMAAPASAGCAVSIGTVTAVRAGRAAHRPAAAARIVAMIGEARAAAIPTITAIPNLAGFANRRE